MARELIAKALAAKRESKYIEFKQSFDPSDLGNWCELIKDLVALANSGGGVLLIGVNNDGSPSQADISGVLQLDSAKFADKLQKYVHANFDGFEVHEAMKSGGPVALIEVAG